MTSVSLVATWPMLGTGGRGAARAGLSRLRRLASESVGVRLVTQLHRADLILVVPLLALEDSSADPMRYSIYSSPALRRNWSRLLVWDMDDNPRTEFPGFFPSLRSAQHDARSNEGAAYLHDYLWHAELDGIAATRFRSSDLASFAGALATSAVRQRLSSLRSRRIQVVDTSAFSWESPAAVRNWRESYWRMLGESAFVLCPRGRGASSVRLYEVMRAGRVPVIIADDWVPPAGPEWSRFSLRVPEANVAGIPDLIAERSGQAAQMGREARQSWLQFFAPETQLRHLIRRGTALCVKCSPWHGRHHLRHLVGERPRTRARAALRHWASRAASVGRLYGLEVVT